MADNNWKDYNIYRQAPDVTEINSANLQFVADDKCLKENIKSQFAWVVITSYSGMSNTLKSLGFEEKTRMSNRFFSHGGDSRTKSLRFWWKQLHDEQPVGPVVLNRQSYGKYAAHNYIHLTGSGCGFALGEPPFNDFRNTYAKYFSLIRIPIDAYRDDLYKAALDRFNFRLIGVGTMSAFYVNGFDPDKWNRDMENEFWAKGGEILEARKESIENISVKFHDWSVKVKKPRRPRVGGLGVRRRVAIPAPQPKPIAAEDKDIRILNP